MAGGEKSVMGNSKNWLLYSPSLSFARSIEGSREANEINTSKELLSFRAFLGIRKGAWNG